MSIRVNVDPSNPGQFFACCGLLEVADRLFQDVEGSFELSREPCAQLQFDISCSGTLGYILDWLISSQPEEITELRNGLKVKRLIAPLRFRFCDEFSPEFVIDFWTQVTIEKRKCAVVANPPWNFWSGNQTSFQIWSGKLRPALGSLRSEILQHPEALLNIRTPLEGRFGFDPGAAWNALDVGFSPNTQKMPVASSPATEMLAAFGLQRFRPAISSDRKSFAYKTWTVHLPPSVAAAAAAAPSTTVEGQRFTGRIIDRGQYAAFGYSKLLTGATT
jgi:CRISPR-associated protein Csb3